jgi:hypothetical protein
VTLPLMNIIFGKLLRLTTSRSVSLTGAGHLVGSFATYANLNLPDARAEFFHNLNKQTLVVLRPRSLNIFMQFSFVPIA